MWSVIIILILVGLALLVLEILVVPGTGVAGIIGFVVMATGIWMAYTRQGTQAGNITLLVTLAVNLIGLVLALRSKTWKKAMLKTEIKGKVNTIDEAGLKVGDHGLTIGRCAPMGKAVFNDTFYEVSAMEEFIDPETAIEIIKISGNKIFIKQIKK
jgi:membrane-bound ClpP family serine protease